MKLFLLTLLVACGLKSEPTMVYICDSSNATRYHLTQNCRGLSNCSHKIVKITLESAQKSNKTLCHWEK